MIVPTEDSDYSTFFYLLKKKIENKPNEKMLEEYGHNLFGFKTDKIADEISPVIINTKYKIPQFGQVVCFDVSYSKSEIKSVDSHIL